MSNLTVAANGNVTQSGALTIGNTADLSATNASIVLTTTSNNFNTLSLLASEANVTDSNAIVLGASMLSNLTVTANGAITQSGAVSVGNTADLTAIVLTTGSNDFNVLRLTAASANVADNGNLTLKNSSTIGTLNVVAANNLNVAAGSAISSNGGELTATGGTLTTGANSTINTGLANFVFNATDMVLGGGAGSITGGNITLRPVMDNGTVIIGSAVGGSGLNLNATELLTLNDAFTNITIGNGGTMNTGGDVVLPEATVTLNASNVVLSAGNNSFDIRPGGNGNTTGRLVVTGGIVDSNTTPGFFASNLVVRDPLSVGGNLIADIINLQSVNFTANAFMRTDTLTLNGAVTGSSQLVLQRETLGTVDIGGARESFLGAPTIGQFGGFSGELIVGGNSGPLTATDFTISNLTVS